MLTLPIVDRLSHWFRNGLRNGMTETDARRFAAEQLRSEVDREITSWFDANNAVEHDPADPGDMDGDHGSALASAGFGTDEDYGYFGDEFEDF